MAYRYLLVVLGLIVAYSTSCKAQFTAGTILPLQPGLRVSMKKILFLVSIILDRRVTDHLQNFSAAYLIPLELSQPTSL